MNDKYLYHFKKTRKERSTVFFNLGGLCILYITALYFFETRIDKQLSEQNLIILFGILGIASVIMFIIAIWHLLNPATYEAYVTKDFASVYYPDNENMSFEVTVNEIEKVVKRQNFFGNFQGLSSEGLRMKNGEFHMLTVTYGNYLTQFYKALNKARPDLNIKITSPWYKKIWNK